MMYVLLVLAFGYVALAWKRLELAILVLAILLPTYLLRFNFVVPLTFLEVMILIVFVVWFLKNKLFLVEQWKTLLKGRLSSSTIKYPFRYAMIAWLIVSFIAVGIGGWSNAAFGVWRAYFFEPLLLFIVVINVFNSKEKIIKLISALGLSVIGVSVFALYQYATGQFIPNEFWAQLEGRRATSFFPYPNAVGLYVGPIILLLIGQVKYVWKSGLSFLEAKWTYVISVLGIILGVGAIVAAKSEGAAFGLVITILIFGLVASRKTRVVTIGIILIACFGLAFNQSARHYVVDRLSLHNFSGQVRRLQWKETFMMLKEGRLISGAGLAHYKTAVAPFHQEGIFVRDYRDPDFQRKVVFNDDFRKSVWQPLEIYLYPHNVILNFWSELGLAGVLVFLWLVVSFFIYGVSAYWKARKNNDPFAYLILGLTLSLAISLIHGIVDVPYFKNDLAALFWLSMAMMGVVSLVNESAKIKSTS